MSRKLLRSLALIAVVIGLAATQLPQLTAKAADPVNLTIFVGLGTGTDPSQLDDQNALAKQWNDAHPDIQIKFVFNDNSTAHDVLLTQIAGGQVPDIVGPVEIGGLNETGDHWADLSSYIKQDTASLKLDDFEKATLNLYQLNGKDIAIPLGIYPSFILVNKDLFDAAQVPLPPTDYNNGKPQYQGKLWDMEAIRQVSIKLTQDKSGNYADEPKFDPKNISIYGFADIDNIMRGYVQLFSPGHAGVAPDGKTAIFNDPTFVQAFQWRHDAIFKDHFFPDLAAQKDLNNSGTTNTFASGRVAMSYSHTWAIGDLGDFKAHWVAAVAPVAPNGKLTARINADTFAILDKSTHKDQAWQVLKWLTSPEIAAKACVIYQCLPARTSSRAGWEKDTKAKFPTLDLNIVYGAVKYLDNPNSEAPMINYNQAFDATTQFMTQLDSDPNMDVKASLDTFNAQMQLIFDGKAPTSTPEPAATAAATP